MKTEILVLAACLLLFGCKVSYKPDEIHFSLIIDLTEDASPTVAEIDATKMRTILKTDNDSRIGACITIYPITDVRYTTILTKKLLSKSEMELNQYERVGEVDTFYKTLDADLSNLKSDMHERKQSFVFYQLNRALNDLASSKTNNKKILAVVSDLCENDKSFFSVYDKKDVALLKNNPEKLMEKLDATYPLKQSLTGITVYFVHRTNPKTDAIYHAMLGFLTNYLTAKQATVESVSSIEHITIPS